jgi:hypothetical protein
MFFNERTYNVQESHTLQSVKEVKDLGFTITSDLSWSPHICKIVKRANTMIYLLFNAFNCPKGSLAQILFKTYVRPILEFGSVIWSPWLVKDKNLLEGVQRKFTKKIPTLTGKPYNERLAELDLCPLEERRITSDLLITYRILNHEYGEELFGIYELSDDSRLRGHGLKLYHEKYKTKCREHFLPNRVFLSWNSLSNDIVQSSSVAIFKNKLQKHLSKIRDHD